MYKFLNSFRCYDVSIRVYDLQGREMNFRANELLLAASSFKLNTENLAAGFYTLQIINNRNGVSEVGKFVKE